MNKTLWKLQQISDRLWTLSVTMTVQAAAFGIDGHGIAIVAEETRNLNNKMQEFIEESLFEGKEINTKIINDIAYQINLLALNATIAAHRLDGKQAAVCAAEIRALAFEIAVGMFADKSEKPQKEILPWPKNPLSSINQESCFISFKVAGITVAENLRYVQEVDGLFCSPTDNSINLRGQDLPLINVPKILDKPLDPTCYIILRSLWSKQDLTKAYAVASDRCDGIFSCRIGTPVAPPADMPLAKYVRECWENENGEPFYFMDWEKMIQK